VEIDDEGGGRRSAVGGCGTGGQQQQGASAGVDGAGTAISVSCRDCRYGTIVFLRTIGALEILSVVRINNHHHEP
jgi:hypothetical protein